MKTTTLPLEHSMQRTPKQFAILITIACALFVLAPATRAQCPQMCDQFANTAVGINALISNTTGTDNTAIGAAALSNNNGAENTATGNNALFANTTGVENTASGAAALFANTTGFENTATGAFTLIKNIDGSDNTAVGFDALRHNSHGSNNIAVGAKAGVNLSTTSNNIDIGNRGVTGEAGTIRIGAVGTHADTFIAGISGVIVPSGVTVVVGSDGHLWTVVSSRQFKEAIKPMDTASDAIFALKPVTFRYKHDLDPQGIPQFGLVAEQVEKVNPDLVARDADGKPYSVRYEAVNAMLLNEFLKEHKAFVEEQHKVQELEANAVRQQKQIEALTAALQKVNAQLELSKSAPKTISYNY